MSPSAIVVRLHVFKDLSFCFVPGLELIPMNQFYFKRVKEALGDGVIPAVALSAHAADELVLGQYGLKVIPGILAAAVGVANKPPGRVAPQDRLPYGLCGQRIGDGFIHRKAYNSPRKQIKDRRHI